MSRYIDADKFKARINASPAFQNMGQDGFFLKELILNILDGQPTADVVERGCKIIKKRRANDGTYCKKDKRGIG